MWVYTLEDAIQLIIPWACTLLLVGVVWAYAVLYIRFKDFLYLSGMYISLIGFFYVLFEALVVGVGWSGSLGLGPYFHRIGQLSSLFFPAGLMFFAWTFSKDRPKLEIIIRILGWIGLVAALAITVIAFVVPHSFISVTEFGTREILSPGDLARGEVGLFYTIRDIFLGLYMLIFAGLAIARLVSNWKDQKILLVVSGILISFWGAADDMIFYQRGTNFFLSQYRFSRVSLGITLMIFCFLTALLKEFLDAQKELHRTYKVLKKSEEKYRLLTEGADQAIFSLKPDFTFHSYNEKANRLFSLHRNKTKELKEILRIHHPQTSHVVEDLFEQKILELKDSECTSFKTLITDPRTGEPEEYDFQFNAIPGEQGEFIGRATRLNQDRLNHYLEYEKLKLSIENYILVVDDVSSRLTMALNKYMDPASVLQVKMGLQEMIINAIEHGNLGIKFEEKSRAMEEGRYIDFLKERQGLEPYCSRSVSIEYVLSSDKVQYLICDEGEGFNYKKTLHRVEKEVDEKMLPHGRGIRMTQVLFDKVQYNSRGNQVLLEKRLA